MLRLTARYANGWNHWSAPDSFRKTSRHWDAACEREGRDPLTIWRSTQALVMVSDSAKSESAATRPRPGRDISNLIKVKTAEGLVNRRFTPSGPTNCGPPISPSVSRATARRTAAWSSTASHGASWPDVFRHC